MKKKARKKRKSGRQADREPWLQLDAVRGPEADAFYRQAQDRFIHMLPLVQEQRLWETYPDPPAEYLARPDGAALEQRAE